MKINEQNNRAKFYIVWYCKMQLYFFKKKENTIVYI